MPTMVELLMDTAAADTELLLRNDAKGDVLATPRAVDFVFRAPDAEKAVLVADFINEHHYGAARVDGDADGRRFLVTIEMPITQPVINSVSGFMACLGRLFEVEYDGWGSVIQPAARKKRR